MQKDLVRLTFSMFPNLATLSFHLNLLTELDVSHAPNLTRLWSHENQLIELDVRNLRHLETLKCDPGTRIIQRPDQNF